jgi:hypothetical protein
MHPMPATAHQRNRKVHLPRAAVGPNEREQVVGKLLHQVLRASPAEKCKRKNEPIDITLDLTPPKPKPGINSAFFRAFLIKAKAMPRIGIIGTGWGVDVQVPAFRLAGWSMISRTF